MTEAKRGVIWNNTGSPSGDKHNYVSICPNGLFIMMEEIGLESNLKTACTPPNRVTGPALSAVPCPLQTPAIHLMPPIPVPIVTKIMFTVNFHQFSDHLDTQASGPHGLASNLDVQSSDLAERESMRRIFPVFLPSPQLLHKDNKARYYLRTQDLPFTFGIFFIRSQTFRSVGPSSSGKLGEGVSHLP
ncbi:hypothetical protein BT69DRAFT_1305698 [Atractiella rhizophila]|nr:hypothetical protein BT69DRAFT_1305698 [Atractiella rhizophila]